MNANASGMTYDDILAKITLNEHRFALEADFVQALFTASEQNSRYHKYHLSFNQRYQLARMGIQTNEVASLSHPHAAAKTIEDYILSTTMPHLLTEDFTALWIKEEKLHRFVGKEGAAVHHMNVLIEVKDHVRYPTGQVGVPAHVKTPLLFIHDAGHHMTPADVAQIFRLSENMHTIYLTIVYPVELITGVDSENPDIYTFSKPTPDSKEFTWYPDGKTNGQYTQPVSGDWWFRYGVIYDDNVALKIKMVETFGSHHVFMVTRKPALPETTMSFQYPTLTEIPGQHSLPLGDRLINRRFLLGMISFCFSALNLNSDILHTKARTLSRDYRGEFITPYDSMRAVGFCVDVLNNPTMHGSGTTLKAGWFAPLQAIPLVASVRTLINKPKALAAHLTVSEFKCPPYVHHIDLKPLYLSKLDTLSYAFGGPQMTCHDTAHLRAILLAIAAGSPDKLDEIVEILKVGRSDLGPTISLENQLSHAIADLILKTTYSLAVVGLGYHIPKLVYGIASALARTMLGSGNLVAALTVFGTCITTSSAVVGVLTPAARVILDRLHAYFQAQLSRPIKYVMRKIIDEYGPEKLRELELKINLSLMISTANIVSLDNLAKARLLEAARLPEDEQNAEAEPLKELEPQALPAPDELKFPDLTPAKTTAYPLSEWEQFDPSPFCDVNNCKSPAIRGDCAVQLLQQYGICRCAWYNSLQPRIPSPGCNPGTVSHGWFSAEEIAQVAADVGLPKACYAFPDGAIYAINGNVDKPDVIMFLEFTGPLNKGHWASCELLLVEEMEDGSTLAPQGRNSVLLNVRPPYPAEDSCMIDAVAHATHWDKLRLWERFVDELPTTGPRSGKSFPRPCTYDDLCLLASVTKTHLVVDRRLTGKKPVAAGTTFGPKAVLEEQPRADVNHLVCRTAVDKHDLPKYIAPRTDPISEVTRKLLNVVGNVTKLHKIDYNRLDLTYKLALANDGYAAIGKNLQVLNAIHAMESSLRNIAFTSLKRRIRIGGVLGLPGAGKTYGFEEVVKEFHKANPRSNAVSWIVPLDELHKQAKKSLGIIPGRGGLVMTHEVALMQNGSQVVIIDELGLFPPGWLDTFLALTPTVKLVLFTGDTCQPRWTSRKTASISHRIKPDLDLVSHSAHAYLLASNRLHVDTCKALGLPFGAHSPRQPDRTGGIFSTPVATTSSVITGNGAREANLREAGVDAFNINNVQGHTFPGSWGLELGPNTTQCNDFQAFVWCTRGKATFQVQTPMRSVTNKGVTTSELNTAVMQQHRSAIARALATGKDLRLRIMQHLKRNIPTRLLDPTRPPKGMTEKELREFMSTLADTEDAQSTREELKREKWGRVGTQRVWLRKAKRVLTPVVANLKTAALSLTRRVSEHMVNVMCDKRFNAMLMRMRHLVSIYSPSYSTWRAESQHHLHTPTKLARREDGLPQAPNNWAYGLNLRKALSKAQALLLSLIYFPVRSFSRERLVNGCWTRQVDGDNNVDYLFCRHRPIDTATVEWTIKERFIAKRDFMPGYVTTGNELYKHLLAALKPMRFVSFDETLYEDCVAEDRLRFLEKGERRIEAIARKADPDWQPTTMQAFLKTQFITKPGCVGIDAKKGQLVLEFSIFLNQRLGPLAKYLQVMLLRMLPDNIYIHAFGNENALEEFVRGNFDFDRKSLEGDFTAFDASEDECFRECVLKFMRHLKIPEHMIAEYSWLEENYECFLGPAAVSMKSGSKMTYIVNCIVTISYLHTRFIIPRSTALCVSGDDSVINHQVREKAGWPLMRKKLRIDLKQVFKINPTFCGWRLTPGGIYKDPEILLARILHQTNRGKLFECAASYACDAQHLQQKFEGLIPYLSELEVDQHMTTVRILRTALKESGQQYSGSTLQDGKFVRFYRL